MKKYRDVMSERMLEFAINIIKLDNSSKDTYCVKHIYGQLFRAGTSAGANFEESIGAESKADFIHKTQLVLKELRESNFWLKLLYRSSMIVNENSNLQLMLHECLELIKIFSSSLVTAKKTLHKNK